LTVLNLSSPPVTPEARAGTAPLIDWLLTDGRNQPGISNLLDAFGPRLIDHGVPVSKIFIAVEQLHPELYADTHIWDRSRGSSVIQRPHASTESELFRQSPLPRILAGAEMVRYDITDDDTDLSYAPGRALKGEGATQAIGLPLPFSAGRRQVITLATDSPPGFSDDQLARIVAVLPALGSVIELYALRDMASGLLDLYVGHDAGERILRGEVKRGSGETINAVIWFCDLAGFTSLTEGMPRDALIALLNEYFDAMAGPVEREGGTILKFIGDGMLAIFPLNDAKEHDAKEHAGEIHQRALRAARQASENIDRLNQNRVSAGEASLSFGIALHVGDVMYGNIGAARRLDFTVIGPAVNMTARLEALSRDLGSSIIISADFARTAGGNFRFLGYHDLRGVRDRQEVFTPD
jgi:adenylate cyclase